MKEGYWLNYGDPGVPVFEIDEHELWLRRPAHARELGVPENVIAGFFRFRQGTDRDRFLPFVMNSASVMRVRCHGVYATFEYAGSDDKLPLKAVKRWCRMFAGPALFLRIVNLRTGRCRTGFPGLKLKTEPVKP